MREDASAGPARRRLTKEERRALILEAAARAFADRGYDAASLEEIADAAGISKPVIYDHFSSKKELHMLLLDEQTRDLLSFMTARVTSRTTSAGQLEAGLDAFFEFVESHPFAWRMLFRDPTAADSEIAALQRRIQVRATSAIAALTAAHPWVDASDDPDREVLSEVVAQLVKTASNGLAAWWYEHREVPRERLVQWMMNFCWIGLERLQRGERWREDRASR